MDIYQSVLLASFIFFIIKRLRLLMHFFQQEEYDGIRFLKILSKGSLIDKKLSFCLIFFSFIPYFISFEYEKTLFSFIILLFAFIEVNPLKTGKKKLVFTKRVKRIYTIALILSLISSYLLLSNITPIILAAILTIGIQPIFLILSNLLLSPYEKHIQNYYLNDAKRILEEYKPTIIGITGSYGKTSTKYILNHILSSVSSTLSTPGSVNTQMGISRIIREKLKAEHKFFISEMGAYGIGSIKRICDLTPPKHGIITSIGDAHYERFKSKDNVAQAKFELAQAVFNKDGKIIINGDMVEQKYINKHCKGHENNFHVLKTNTHSRYAIDDRKVTKDGISFKFCIDSDETIITAPVYGMHQCDNIALCTTLCCKIGVPLSSIVASLKTLPQTEHRLQVFKSNNSATIIDDAYNSNPTGFTSALEVLSILGEEKQGKKILVTPGMVELGELHDEEHKKIAQKAIKHADTIIAIIPNRIKAFTNEIKKHKNIELLEFENFEEAKIWLDKNATKDDVILYENDLPDLYETKITL